MDSYDEISIPLLNEQYEESIHVVDVSKQKHVYNRSLSDGALKTHTLYNTRVTKLGKYMEVRYYHQDRIKKIEDLEMEVIKKKFTKKGDASNVIAQRSFYRSFITLRNYAFGSLDHFKSFITLTFSDNVESADIAYKKFRIWVMLVKRIYPEFMYLGVPERQKRGAIHFHILTNLVPGCDLMPKREALNLWRPDLNTYLTIEYYDLGYWSHGFSSCFDLNTTDENFNIIAYLAKYFWKEKDDSFFGRKKILHSQNLRKPDIEFMHSNSSAYEDYKKALEGMQEVKNVFVESESQFGTDVTICEYKKI